MCYINPRFTFIYFNSVESHAVKMRFGLGIWKLLQNNMCFTIALKLKIRRWFLRLKLQSLPLQCIFVGSTCQSYHRDRFLQAFTGYFRKKTAQSLFAIILQPDVTELCGFSKMFRKKLFTRQRPFKYSNIGN